MLRKLFIASVALLLSCSPQVKKPGAQSVGGADKAGGSEISQIVLYARSAGEANTPLVWDIRKIALDRADGRRIDIPGTTISLKIADLRRGQKLLAVSEVEEGTYTGLTVFSRGVYFSDTDQEVTTATKVFSFNHDFTVLSGNAKSIFMLVDVADPGDRRESYEFVPRITVLDEDPTPSSEVIYVANELSSNISIIDKQLKRVVYNVFVGTKPYALAADNRRNRLYIGDRKDGVISEMDMLRQHLLRATQIEYVDEPVHIEPVPSRDLLIVVNFGSDTIYIVDSFTLQVVQTIEVGYEPVDAVYSDLFDIAFVLNRYFGTLSVLDFAADTVKVDTTLQVELDPAGMAIDDNMGWLYITNSGSTDLSILKMRTLGIEKTVSVGVGAGDIEFDPFGRRVYIAMTATREIICVDPYTGILEYSIDLPSEPGKMLFDDDEKRLYACLPGRSAVVVIDPMSRRIDSWIETGRGPSSLAPRW